MRINLPVTGREREYPRDVQLISATDPKGRITYANDAFCAVSGFPREALLGAPHNVVRHPDMPPQVFASMWRTLAAGRTWLGVVRNRCANGDHYWTDAVVAPMVQGGSVTGYESVRVRPEPEHVRRADS